MKIYRLSVSDSSCWYNLDLNFVSLQLAHSVATWSFVYSPIRLAVNFSLTKSCSFYLRLPAKPVWSVLWPEKSFVCLFVFLFVNNIVSSVLLYTCRITSHSVAVYTHKLPKSSRIGHIFPRRRKLVGKNVTKFLCRKKVKLKSPAEQSL